MASRMQPIQPAPRADIPSKSTVASFVAFMYTVQEHTYCTVNINFGCKEFQKYKASSLIWEIKKHFTWGFSGIKSDSLGKGTYIHEQSQNSQHKRVQVADLYPSMLGILWLLMNVHTLSKGIALYRKIKRTQPSRLELRVYNKTMYAQADQKYDMCTFQRT